MRSATPCCPSRRTSNCSRSASEDPDFQQSLADALQEGVKRVSRLVGQMRYLARDRMDQRRVRCR
jgi:hypothetical protein